VHIDVRIDVYTDFSMRRPSEGPISRPRNSTECVPYSLVDVYRRFRGACYRRHQSDRPDYLDFSLTSHVSIVRYLNLRKKGREIAVDEELYDMHLSYNFLCHWIKKVGIGMTCSTDGEQENVFRHSVAVSQGRGNLGVESGDRSFISNWILDKMFIKYKPYWGGTG
jgi:hypothetical protein